MFTSGAVAAIVVGVLILAAILEGGLPFGVSFALTLVMFAFTIVVDCVFAPLSYAALSATFYEFSQERGIDIPYRIDEPSRTCRTRLARAAVGSFLAMLGLVSLLSYDPLHGVFESESQREPAPDFAITAHRGGAREAPENTLAAFQNAIDQGADWVELDVQQTADGVLVVMHDMPTSSARRVWIKSSGRSRTTRSKTSTTAAGSIPHSQTSGYARWKSACVIKGKIAEYRVKPDATASTSSERRSTSSTPTI